MEKFVKLLNLQFLTFIHIFYHIPVPAAIETLTEIFQAAVLELNSGNMRLKSKEEYVIICKSKEEFAKST